MLARLLMSFSAFCLAQFAINAASAQPFVPDREYFFEQCGTIPGFHQDRGNPTVTERGTRTLSASARETIDDFFDEWEAMGGQDQRRLAYIIATTFRETQGTMLPIREAPQCGEDEACRERVIGSAYARANERGLRYYGRGYVQITGERNYRRLGGTLGVGEQFVDNPDLVMEPAHARAILFRGMTDGLFAADRSGNAHTLARYFNEETEDWVNARRIVNPGSSRKEVTGALGRHFNGCLRAAAPS